MNRFTLIGLSGTVLWIGLILLVLWKNPHAASTMSLTQWADFLAGGVSAPLALLWLVVGHFQQGRELSVNTRALEEQVRETRLLAQNSERQAAAAELHARLTQTAQERERFIETHEAQPLIRNQGGTSSGTEHNTQLLNQGGSVRDVELEYGGEYDLTFSLSTAWDTGQVGRLRLIERSKLQFPGSSGNRVGKFLGRNRAKPRSLRVLSHFDCVRTPRP